MKVLVITNLFPNSKEPTRGMYNLQQKQELAKLCDIEVIAPVPFYKKGIASQEEIEGIKVHHPKYFFAPKILRSFYGHFFYYSLVDKVKKIYKNFKFDVILASWAYPDGVGSVFIAKELNIPVMVEALGTDVNLYTKYFLRKYIISSALKKAEKIMTVSIDLKKRLEIIGIPEEKIFVNPNGINSSLFHPTSKEECRKKLGINTDYEMILFVGNLVPVKGLKYLINAFTKLSQERPNLVLFIIGGGKLKTSLEEQAFKLGVKEKIKFIGKRSHEEIPDYINSCDVFCLPSLNEGCPNVILEAMACGKPVVASRVGGIPDMIPSDKFGVLVEPQDAIALAEGLNKALLIEWDKEFTQKGYSTLSWASSTKYLFEQIETVVSNA